MSLNKITINVNEINSIPTQYGVFHNVYKCDLSGLESSVLNGLEFSPGSYLPYLNGKYTPPNLSDFPGFEFETIHEPCSNIDPITSFENDEIIQYELVKEDRSESLYFRRTKGSKFFKSYTRLCSVLYELQCEIYQGSEIFDSDSLIFNLKSEISKIRSKLNPSFLYLMKILVQREIYNIANMYKENGASIIKIDGTKSMFVSFPEGVDSDSLPKTLHTKFISLPFCHVASDDVLVKTSMCCSLDVDIVGMALRESFTLDRFFEYMDSNIDNRKRLPNMLSFMVTNDQLSFLKRNNYEIYREVMILTRGDTAFRSIKVLPVLNDKLSKIRFYRAFYEQLPEVVEVNYYFYYMRYRQLFDPSQHDEFDRRVAELYPFAAFPSLFVTNN